MEFTRGISVSTSMVGRALAFNTRVMQPLLPGSTGGVVTVPHRVTRGTPRTSLPLSRRDLQPSSRWELVALADGMLNGRSVVRPLLRLFITDEDADGVFVVSDAFSTVYGAGETEDDAIQDYLGALAIQVASLEVDADNLGPRLLSELTAIRRQLGWHNE